MYYKFIRDYVFVTPIMPIEAFDYCRQLNSTCGINLDVFIEQVNKSKEAKKNHSIDTDYPYSFAFALHPQLFPKTCSDFMFNLTYMGREHKQCENLFKMHKTELGVCFVANSIYD